MTIKDLPDNYPWLPDTGRYPLTDVGELAARLESIVTYDRRGSVILIDRCIVGKTSWVTTAFGTGSGVKTVAGEHPVEPYSISLVAGSDGAQQAQMSKSIPSFGSYNFGIQISFRLAAAGYRFDFLLYYYTGAEVIMPRISVNVDALEFRYLDEDSNYQSIATIGNLASLTNTWHTIKLVFDIENREYIRAMLNENEYPLAGIPLRVEDDLTVKYKYIAALNIGGGGNNPDIYVNDLVLTIGEK